MMENPRLRKIKAHFQKFKYEIFILLIFLSLFLAGLAAYPAYSVFAVDIFIFLIVIESNRRLFEKLNHVPETLDILIGTLLIIFSFELILIKERFTEEFAGFGVTNLAVYLAGLLVLFYGLKNIPKYWMVVLVLGTIAFLNIFLYSSGGMWGDIGSGGPEKGIYLHAARTLSYPEGQFVAGSLNLFGYNVTIKNVGDSGTDLFIKNGGYRIAGACTGIVGTSLFAVTSFAILSGMNIRIRWKIILIVAGTIGAFMLNLLRLIILAQLIYHYDMSTMLWWHKNEYFGLGDLMFLLYLGLFVFIIWLFFLRSEAMAQKSGLSAQ